MFKLSTWIAPLIIALAPFTAMAKEKPLTIDVFTSGASGFHVTSTLISGEKEMILVDGQFTLSAAHRLTAKIIESGKELKRVFITHAHPDHYFGLEVLKKQFPKVEFLASSEVVEQMKVMGPQKLAAWKPMYGNNLTNEPIVAKKYDSKELILEGQKIEIHELEPGEIEHSTVLFVPSAKALIAGDLSYNGIHPWLAEADTTRRKQWIANLNFAISLNPEIVVAGHKQPDAVDGPSSLRFTRDYVKYFDSVVSSSKTAEAAKQKILARYPELGLPIILDIAIKAAYGAPAQH